MLPLHGIYILISLFIAFSQTKLDEFAFNKLICSLTRERGMGGKSWYRECKHWQ